MAMVNSALIQNGIPQCVGKTVASGAPSGEDDGRAREITTFVANHPELCARGWVALDDMALGALLPPGKFVRTEPEAGLTAANATKAIELLGGPDASAPPLPPIPSKPGGFNVLVTRGEMQRDAMRAAMADL